MLECFKNIDMCIVSPVELKHRSLLRFFEGSTAPANIFNIISDNDLVTCGAMVQLIYWRSFPWNSPALLGSLCVDNTSIISTDPHLWYFSHLSATAIPWTTLYHSHRTLIPRAVPFENRQSLIPLFSCWRFRRYSGLESMAGPQWAATINRSNGLWRAASL